MSDSNDYYAILGVSKNATPEEIKAAYKSAAKYYHPDVNSSSNANYMFNLIQDAYEHLMNQSSQVNGVICGKCGKKNESSSSFCYWCGNSLQNNKQTSNQNINGYFDLVLTSINNKNFSDCIKYSSLILDCYPNVLDAWFFKCVGIVGLYGIVETNTKEYREHLEKVKGLYNPNIVVETSAINVLLAVISEKFKEDIWTIYNECNVRHVVEHEGVDSLFDDCKALIYKTDELITVITDFFGSEYLIQSYKYMNRVITPIRDDIVQNKWPKCKEAINGGRLYDTYELCMFTQWLTQAPFIDPNIKLNMNYNAIQMLAYHQNHISRRDTKMMKINSQYANELKEYRNDLEKELQQVNEFKKELGL